MLLICNGFSSDSSCFYLQFKQQRDLYRMDLQNEAREMRHLSRAPLLPVSKAEGGLIMA